MIVKDPLQGIKSVTGHVCMHVAFAMTMTRVPTDIYTDPDSVSQAKASLEQRAQLKYEEYQIFQMIYIGHILCAVFQLVSMQAKASNAHFLQKICNLGQYCAYLFPMIMCMWTLRNVISTNDKYSDVFWTQVRRWFVLE